MNEISKYINLAKKAGAVIYGIDNIVKNNKVKITRTNKLNKASNVVIGYIDINDVFKKK